MERVNVNDVFKHNGRMFRVVRVYPDGTFQLDTKTIVGIHIDRKWFFDTSERVEDIASA
jgi:hypothetical protein